MDQSELKTVIHTVLNERDRIDGGIHKDHHEYIRRLIQKEQRKQEIWDKVKAHILGWGIVGLVGTLGTIILQQFTGK